MSLILDIYLKLLNKGIKDYDLIFIKTGKGSCVVVTGQNILCKQNRSFYLLVYFIYFQISSNMSYRDFGTFIYGNDFFWNRIFWHWNSMSYSRFDPNVLNIMCKRVWRIFMWDKRNFVKLWRWPVLELDDSLPELRYTYYFFITLVFLLTIWKCTSIYI